MILMLARAWLSGVCLWTIGCAPSHARIAQLPYPSEEQELFGQVPESQRRIHRDWVAFSPESAAQISLRCECFVSGSLEGRAIEVSTRPGEWIRSDSGVLDYLAASIQACNVSARGRIAAAIQCDYESSTLQYASSRPLLGGIVDSSHGPVPTGQTFEILRVGYYFPESADRFASQGGAGTEGCDVILVVSVRIESR